MDRWVLVFFANGPVGPGFFANGPVGPGDTVRTGIWSLERAVRFNGFNGFT
jgi:hypothetical protein